MKQLLLLLSFCFTLDGVLLNGEDVPKDHLIFFIFIGHSNMEGYGGSMDQVTNPRSWVYDNNKGFWQASDPIATTHFTPSPVMPFIKLMADSFPDYYFCAIKVPAAGLAMTETFVRGKAPYSTVMSTYNSVKEHGTLGGILCMFGWIEGGSDSLSHHFSENAMTVVSNFREDCGIPDLPVVWGRYEENADTVNTPYKNYYKYASRIKASIDTLPRVDPMHRLLLTPEYPIPGNMFIDDHHYTGDGYNLWSRTAVILLKKYGWTKWASNATPPDTLDTTTVPPDTSVTPPDTHTIPIDTSCIRIVQPNGGQIFSSGDSIYLQWRSTVDSIDLFSISIIDSSGLTWKNISGVDPVTSRLTIGIPPFSGTSTFYMRIDAISKKGKGYQDRTDRMLYFRPPSYLVPSCPDSNILSATNVSDTSITVSWQCNGAESYLLYINNTPRLFTTCIGSIRYTFNHLTADSSYSIYLCKSTLPWTWSVPVDSIIRKTSAGGRHSKPLALEYPRSPFKSTNDTVTIRWTYNDLYISSILVYSSVNKGKTWDPVTTEGGIPATDQTYNFLVSRIYPELDNPELFLKIVDYSFNYADQTVSNCVTLENLYQNNNSKIIFSARNDGSLIIQNPLLISHPIVNLYNLQGSKLHTLICKKGSPIIIKASDNKVQTGVYLICASNKNRCVNLGIWHKVK